MKFQNCNLVCVYVCLCARMCEEVTLGLDRFLGRCDLQ